ncbi:predicted protein [Histoplasma mississippiense (nom. inval.)]|nr:predicted protein [Histoplasma mississippiense (nom. inval.)]EDN04315.1 predicted protein [Histoplasma mississippiense (nom. inval.)]
MPEESGLYCILCAGFIHYQSPRESWQTEFRAVRVTHGDGDGDGDEKKRFLTGVGGFIHRDFPFSAPSNPDQRYDDKEYRVSPLDEFVPFLSVSHRIDIGYAFHDLCWRLLNALSYPDPVPIDRFYDICSSFHPRSQNWLPWGHTYGGLLKADRVYYPWEEARLAGMITGSVTKPKLSPYYYYKQDPWNIPELQQILAETKESPGRESCNDELRISCRPQQHADCFSMLPVELLEEIMTQLLVKDVASLRRASRSFASLPLTQYFWSSRFRPEMDRDFIFEATIADRESAVSAGRRDWRVLYEKTGQSLLEGGALANRRRIWNCNRSLARLLSIEPLDKERLARADRYNNIVWKAVGARYPSNQYSRLYVQAARLPREISRIAVSLITLNGKQYVSGIRISSRKERGVDMGYIIPSSEIVLDLENENGTPVTLSGFITAVGPSGIHALRATTLEGVLSIWGGCPDSKPVTLRLCNNERISHLKCAFDGFKLVAISVPDPEVGSHERPPHLPLRTTAIWYPTVPPEDVYLHESTFAGKEVPQSEYHPLIHVMFGGPQGSYLKYLTRISVTVSGQTIVGIDFEYGGESAPVERLQAGRNALGGDDSLRIPFTVDGPGGEILTGIQVNGDCWKNITSIKVATNRNRQFTFQPNAIPQLRFPPGPLVRKKMGKIEITPGTTIIGIYIMHDSFAGMIGLGPISKRLPEYSDKGSHAKDKS